MVLTAYHPCSISKRAVMLAVTIATSLLMPELAGAQVSGQGAKTTPPVAAPKTTPARAVNPCMGASASRYDLVSIDGNRFSVKMLDGTVETVVTDKKTVFYRHGKQVSSLAAFKDLVGKTVRYYQGDCDKGKDADGHAIAFKVDDGDITAPVR